MKRSITIAGHRTSISLEEPFWAGLRRIAEQRNISLAALIAGIDRDRHPGQENLSSELRVFVLDFYRRAAERSSPE